MGLLCGQNWTRQSFLIAVGTQGVKLRVQSGISRTGVHWDNLNQTLPGTTSTLLRRFVVEKNLKGQKEDAYSLRDLPEG